MTKENKFIFSQKELYQMEHTESGISRRITSIPTKKRRRQIYDNMHLMEGMTFTPKLHFPQQEAYNGSIDFIAVPFTERKRYDGKNLALHFFLDDYRFRDAVWCNLEGTTFEISKYDFFLTPDLSLWKDLPTDYYNRQNIFRSRFVGAYWQLCGLSVIPTASWGDLNSFSYCFEGLPERSVIAVSGMGNRRTSDAFNRWCYGLRRLEDSKCPTLIIVYGEEIDVPGLNTPLHFIPDFITTKLRKINGNK